MNRSDDIAAESPLQRAAAASVELPQDAAIEMNKRQLSQNEMQMNAMNAMNAMNGMNQMPRMNSNPLQNPSSNQMGFDQMQMNINQMNQFNGIQSNANGMAMNGMNGMNNGVNMNPANFAAMQRASSTPGTIQAQMQAQQILNNQMQRIQQLQQMNAMAAMNMNMAQQVQQQEYIMQRKQTAGNDMIDDGGQVPAFERVDSYEGASIEEEQQMIAFQNSQRMSQISNQQYAQFSGMNQAQNQPYVQNMQMQMKQQPQR